MDDSTEWEVLAYPMTDITLPPSLLLARDGDGASFAVFVRRRWEGREVITFLKPDAYELRGATIRLNTAHALRVNDDLLIGRSGTSHSWAFCYGAGGWRESDEAYAGQISY